LDVHRAGLYRHERNASWPFLLMTPVSLLSARASLFPMLPYAIRFFLSYETQGIQLQARVGEYLSFVMTLIFAFGFCFEMPVLLMLLAASASSPARVSKNAALRHRGRVRRGRRADARRDVISQLSLAFPMVAPYEISILGVCSSSAAVPSGKPRTPPLLLAAHPAT